MIRWYIVARNKNHKARLMAFCEILQLTIPQTYQKLMSIGALEDCYLNEIFIYFFSNLFEKPVVEKIVELFLLEGNKVLYRFGLALFAYHKYLIKSADIMTGVQLWSSIKDKSTQITYKELELIAFNDNRRSIFRKLISGRIYLSRKYINERERILYDQDLSYQTLLDTTSKLMTLDSNEQNDAIIANPSTALPNLTIMLSKLNSGNIFFN